MPPTHGASLRLRTAHRLASVTPLTAFFDADDVLVIVGARDVDDASAGSGNKVDAVVVGPEDRDDIGDAAFAGAGG